MKVFFVGQTWKGSSARSLKEGLEKIDGTIVEEVGEDLFRPKGNGFLIRASNKLLKNAQRKEISEEVIRKVKSFKPDVFIVYKGGLIGRKLIRWVKSQGVYAVNVFPDVSPHSHGAELSDAIGEYDLVISTKIFHPPNWGSKYGYRNTCAFVPHGYDPSVHLWAGVPDPLKQNIDIAVAATYRSQYLDFLLEFDRLLNTETLNVVLAGNGWGKVKHLLPSHWVLPGGLYGRSYGELLRNSKIVIAPVHSKEVFKGDVYPGDEDTTRSYELASIGCFFLHYRTCYIRQVYDEVEEVPMWGDVKELASHVEYYIDKPKLRSAMASKAYRRAVPSYSTDSRAVEVLRVIKEYFHLKYDEKLI